MLHLNAVICFTSQPLTFRHLVSICIAAVQQRQLCICSLLTEMAKVCVYIYEQNSRQKYCSWIFAQIYYKWCSQCKV